MVAFFLNIDTSLNPFGWKNEVGYKGTFAFKKDISKFFTTFTLNKSLLNLFTCRSCNIFVLNFGDYLQHFFIVVNFLKYLFLYDRLYKQKKPNIFLLI